MTSFYSTPKSKISPVISVTTAFPYPWSTQVTIIGI